MTTVRAPAALQSTRVHRRTMRTCRRLSAGPPACPPTPPPSCTPTTAATPEAGEHQARTGHHLDHPGHKGDHEQRRRPGHPAILTVRHSERSRLHRSSAPGRLAQLAWPPPHDECRPHQDPRIARCRPPRGTSYRAGPFLCYLTIDGLDRATDQRKLIRLRGRIHAAARMSAEGRHTTYHATDSAITIGIHDPDAQERINQLRDALSKLITKRWTTRDEPR